MADIGYISLFLAIIASVYAAVTFIIGTRQKRPDLTKSARNGVIASFGLTTIAIGILIAALVGRDFSIEYVASYTDRSLSLLYTITAVWAGNDGSMLFWVWVLSLCATIMVLQKRDVGKELVPYAASVAMLPQIFFLMLLLSITNPFAKLPFTPADGMGLNPLLENPGMLLHPPTQLGGYVLFTIPFSFAIAALITGKLGDDWIVMGRRWTLMAWMVLGIGNIFGSWWAYYVLGWGGFWGWDPVENAGLLPWLVATAFLHSAMMQRRRGILKRWNMILIILTFVLSIFGTFLTRSGILGSVHTFSESSLGIFFLGFIGFTLIGSLILFYYRNAELKSETQIESVISRESTFLLNNLLLVTGTFTVILGTVFPIISEAVRGVKITVGPPFYDQIMQPIFLATIFITGVCTMIGWRRASKKNLLRTFVFPLTATVVLAIVLFILGIRQGYTLTAVAICSFVLLTIFYEIFRGIRARHHLKSENYLKAFFGLIAANRPRYGGYIVHIGIIIFAIGVIGYYSYSVEKDTVLKSGESVTLNGYTFTYQAIDRIETQSKVTYTTTLKVSNGEGPMGEITAEKYFHRNHDNPVSVAGVRSTFMEDLYVILINWEADGSAVFKVKSNPVVNWIWLGSGILILGGLIAFWPERRKQGPRLISGAKTAVKRDENEDA